MPEYPEVETLRRNLSRTLPGRVIAAVDLRLPKLLQPAPGLGPADLVGRTVQGLRRRGKVLIIDLSDGLSLVLHLKLTGQIVLVDASGQVVVAGGHPVPAFGSPLPGEQEQYVRLSFAASREQVHEGIGRFRAWMEEGGAP